jgi:hypothetical protein
MVSDSRAAATFEDEGLCLALDAANLAAAFGGGNAVVTQVSEVDCGAISISINSSAISY